VAHSPAEVRERIVARERPVFGDVEAVGHCERIRQPLRCFHPVYAEAELSPSATNASQRAKAGSLSYEYLLPVPQKELRIRAPRKLLW
jgi:hypothetical protein